MCSTGEATYFRGETVIEGEVFHPLPPAVSLWDGGRQLRGTATSGLLARAAERAVAGVAGLTVRPVRWTLDLLRPARAVPSTVSTALVRKGRRLCLVDAALHQQGSVVARASALFLAADGLPRGHAWTAPHTVSLPPATLRPGTTEPRLYYSDAVGWTDSPAPHQNATRKMTWLLPVTTVEGESASAFQQVAQAADLVNSVSNWGDAGLEFINADVTLAIARLPKADLGVGLAAVHRIEHGGVAVGTATVYDRYGPLGTVTASALLSEAPVDPRQLGLRTLSPHRDQPVEGAPPGT